MEEITLGTNLSLSGTTLNASGGGSSGPTAPGGIPLTGVKYPAAYNMSINTGDTDVYTVPANKRAAVFTWAVINNSGVGNILVFPQVKISGVYYRLGYATQTIANGSTSANSILYVAEAGEILSFNTTTNNGLAAWYKVVEFDNTCALSSPKLTSLSAGDNALYTVTSGKTGLVMNSTTFISSTATTTLWYVNMSGVNRTVFPKLTPSGGSATQVNASQVVSDKQATFFNVPTSLASGDALIINTDAATATQWTWTTVMEI